MQPSAQRGSVHDDRYAANVGHHAGLLSSVCGELASTVDGLEVIDSDLSMGSSSRSWI